MTNEELEEIRKQNAKRPTQYVEGWCACMHAEADVLLEDAKQLAEDGDARTSVLRTYLLDRAAEMHKDAERLRP